MAAKEKAKEDKLIAVVAIGDHFGKVAGEVVGYLGHRMVKVGDKLRIRESQFSKRWMERLTDKVSKEVAEEEADLEADQARHRDTDDSVI